MFTKDVFKISCAINDICKDCYVFGDLTVLRLSLTERSVPVLKYTNLQRKCFVRYFSKKVLLRFVLTINMHWWTELISYVIKTHDVLDNEITDQSAFIRMLLQSNILFRIWHSWHISLYMRGGEGESKMHLPWDGRRSQWRTQLQLQQWDLLGKEQPSQMGKLGEQGSRIRLAAPASQLPSYKQQSLF